jgi:hypothetical protein
MKTSWRLLLRLMAVMAFAMLALVLVAPRQTARSDDTQPSVSAIVSNTLRSGYMLVEGDMLVPVDFYERGRSNRPDSGYLSNLWPDGVVPYEFDANVTAAWRTAMLTAMTDWETAATVNFRAKVAGDVNYVHIMTDATLGNTSYVGMIGGVQTITIYNWNYEFKMAHELAHALSYIHEQSRPDRDASVSVLLACVLPGKEHNFNINASADQYGPYDFDSVMHYDQTAFLQASPTCTRTIVVKPPNEAWQTLIGQRDHLSDMDKLTMSFLYPQSDWRFVDWSYGGDQTGSFLQPYTLIINAMNAAPDNGTVWIQPGSYWEGGTWSKPITLRAPLGGVTIGQ